MDYHQMTAPCGLDCFNCVFYLATQNDEARAQVGQMSEKTGIPMDSLECHGCRHHAGRIPALVNQNGESFQCGTYTCASENSHHHCGECDNFPCERLQPVADKAQVLPHNIKVFNLLMINKIGLETWSKTKSSEIRSSYFTKPWSLE
jgi:hypothetical protein